MKDTLDRDISMVDLKSQYTRLKSDIDRAIESDVLPTVIHNIPEIMQEQVAKLLDDYAKQSTPEARFVKAIDKVEVVFEVLDENYISVFNSYKVTYDQYNQTKLPYVQDYPYIKRFCEVAGEEMEKRNYFSG